MPLFFPGNLSKNTPHDFPAFVHAKAIEPTRKRGGAVTAWFWYFIIYSFFGFVLEVLFARVTRNPKRDRKCFYLLPLCPVYGFGGLLILALAPFSGGNPWRIALFSFLAATAAEYLMGLFYEKALGVAFWDYRHLPLNIGGKVCLLFSLMWCVLGLGLVYGVHPAVAAFAAALPGWLALPAFLLVALDAGYSMALLKREGHTDALMWYRHKSGATERRGA